MSYTEINIFAAVDEERKGNYKIEQTAYIVFMMVGSYFRSCESHNHFLEKKYCMLYKEMKELSQIGLEARIEKEFLESCPFAPEVFDELRATARISRGKDDASVWFRTGFEEVLVHIDEEGRRTWQYRSEGRIV